MLYIVDIMVYCLPGYISFTLFNGAFSGYICPTPPLSLNRQKVMPVLTINGRFIYTAPYVMILIRANQLRRPL